MYGDLDLCYLFLSLHLASTGRPHSSRLRKWKETKQQWSIAMYSVWFWIRLRIYQMECLSYFKKLNLFFWKCVWQSENEWQGNFVKLIFTLTLEGGRGGVLLVYFLGSMTHEQKFIEQK